MATYSHTTTTSTVHRWIIPAAEPWGAAAGEVGKAWTAAAVEYRRLHGMPEDASLSDDAMWFHVTDDEIVIQFVTKAPGGAK